MTNMSMQTIEKLKKRYAFLEDGKNPLEWSVLHYMLHYVRNEVEKRVKRLKAPEDFLGSKQKVRYFTGLPSSNTLEAIFKFLSDAEYWSGHGLSAIPMPVMM